MRARLTSSAPSYTNPSITRDRSGDLGDASKVRGQAGTLSMRRAEADFRQRLGQKLEALTLLGGGGGGGGNRITGKHVLFFLFFWDMVAAFISVHFRNRRKMMYICTFTFRKIHTYVSIHTFTHKHTHMMLFRGSGWRVHCGVYRYKSVHISVDILVLIDSRGSGWRVHCGVEVTELSSNKQQKKPYTYPCVHACVC